MVICQTLWTSGKDLLKHNFGWLTPQHHIMGWALSLLRLRRFYSTVNLHTDSAGVALFKDKLNLPYTQFFDDYSKLTCQPNLWALPKLLSYEKQKAPFLHVDGDIFIWHPLEKQLLSSNLIAQNLENGTIYYKKLLLPFADQLDYIPNFLKKNLLSHNMRSYNLGIVGGHDTNFFKRYVTAAKEFIDRNNVTTLNGSFNILFEQLLFFSVVLKEKKNVACLYSSTLNDNGYLKKETASFPRADQLGYLHLIGGFKRDKEICDWLARRLRKEDEETFLRIVSLFKKTHYYYNTKLKEVYPSIASVKRSKFRYHKTERFVKSMDDQVTFNSNASLYRYIQNSENVLLKELFRYEQKIYRICSKFSKIKAHSLNQLEDDSIKSAAFLSMDQETRMPLAIRRHPHIEVIHSAFDWISMHPSNFGNLNIRCSSQRKIIMGVIPELFFSGYREVRLDKTCVNLILLTEEEISYQRLLDKMSTFFQALKDDNDYKSFYKLVSTKVEYLVANKMLFICNSSTESVAPH